MKTLSFFQLWIIDLKTSKKTTCDHNALNPNFFILKSLPYFFNISGKDLGDFIYRIYIGMFPTIKSPKISNQFICETCHYKCCKQSEYTKHISTNKHKILQNPTSDGTPKVYLCTCGKQYKHSSTLYAHKKICTYNQNIPAEDTQTNTADTITNPIIIEKMFTMFTQMMTQNQDFMTNVIGKVQGITNNNNSHNTNNQFNINMFLNEHCKNAMNISDFIRSLPITAQDYENTKDHGLADTLTHIIVDGLNNLDVVDRPIHCTDQKRKTMYVKDKDIWEKDDHLNILMTSIRELTFLHRKSLDLWKGLNPEYEVIDKLQSAYATMIEKLFTDVTECKSGLSKLIKGITTSSYIDNETKLSYSQ
jgi:hypothetical protein